MKRPASSNNNNIDHVATTNNTNNNHDSTTTTNHNNNKKIRKDTRKKIFYGSQKLAKLSSSSTSATSPIQPSSSSSRVMPYTSSSSSVSPMICNRSSNTTVVEGVTSTTETAERCRHITTLGYNNDFSKDETKQPMDVVEESSPKRDKGENRDIVVAAATMDPPPQLTHNMLLLHEHHHQELESKLVHHTPPVLSEQGVITSLNQQDTYNHRHAPPPPDDDVSLSSKNHRNDYMEYQPIVMQALHDTIRAQSHLLPIYQENMHRQDLYIGQLVHEKNHLQQQVQQLLQHQLQHRANTLQQQHLKYSQLKRKLYKSHESNQILHAQHVQLRQQVAAAIAVASTIAWNSSGDDVVDQHRHHQLERMIKSITNILSNALTAATTTTSLPVAPQQPQQRRVSMTPARVETKLHHPREEEHATDSLLLEGCIINGQNGNLEASSLTDHVVTTTTKPAQQTVIIPHHLQKETDASASHVPTTPLGASLEQATNSMFTMNRDDALDETNPETQWNTVNEMLVQYDNRGQEERKQDNKDCHQGLLPQSINSQIVPSTAIPTKEDNDGGRDRGGVLVQTLPMAGDGMDAILEEVVHEKTKTTTPSSTFEGITTTNSATTNVDDVQNDSQATVVAPAMATAAHVDEDDPGHQLVVTKNANHITVGSNKDNYHHNHNNMTKRPPLKNIVNNNSFVSPKTTTSSPRRSSSFSKKSKSSNTGWMSNKVARSFDLPTTPYLSSNATKVERNNVVPKQQTPSPRATAKLCNQRRDVGNGFDNGRNNNAMDNDHYDDDTQHQQQPDYKYHETVRCKAARANLPCRFCDGCGDFRQAVFQGPGASKFCEDAFMARSRHRARFSPENTPENFWDLSFQDEIEARKQQQQCADEEDDALDGNDSQETTIDQLLQEGK